MMLFNYCRRVILSLICLVYSGHIAAERDIGNHIDLPQAQLQQLELNNFKVLGLVQLDQNAGPDYPLMEFSGLAWDHDEQILVILSDRGFFIYARPVFHNEKLTGLKLLSYHYLKDKDGKKLRHKAADSEGLALINSKNNVAGDTELIISFERQPRIVHYKADGTYKKDEPLNNDLDTIKNYAGANKALEAVTLHEQFNIITGPERPLKQSRKDALSLHTLNRETWYFSPDNEEHSSLVGLTTLPDNRLIALERIFSSIFSGVSNVIHLLTLNNDTLQQEKLLKLNAAEGYFNDNFEGITWHKNNSFFIISDDNDNLFQRTLLVHFQIPKLGNN